MNPSIFVLDEPTANLDADAIDTLRQQIIQIKEEGRTVVIAEHRLYFLMDLIDRAIFIQKGKIVQIFSGDEFRNLSDEQRIRMGLQKSCPSCVGAASRRSTRSTGRLIRRKSFLCL